jgi:hypothetical protein
MKARKGDLVLVEVLNRTYVIGAGTSERTEYRYGVVHSATRDGQIKTWSELGFGDQLHSDYGQPLRGRSWVLPKADVDVESVLKAAKAHHWPDHPGQPMPFDSFDAARDVARPYAVVGDGS